LSKALSGIPGVGLLNSTAGPYTSSYYCLSVILDDHLAARRADIVAKLNAAGVGTSVYYPQPVPRMTYYRQRYGWRDGSYPNAARNQRLLDRIAGRPHLTGEDMQYIGATLADVVRGK
jgi:dTDP-4-amino-4,6-dideoxygalactose transaminase